MSHIITHLLTVDDVKAHMPSLRTLIQSCDNPDPSTSSIGFLAPLSDADADGYWMTVSSKLSEAHHLFELTNPAGSQEILATVQLVTVLKRTHAHRGEVAKLLVRPFAQCRGLGRLMMEHVEKYAREQMGMTLLTLDTETDTAARAFYNDIGWTEWGTCPDYAAYADGKLGGATFFRESLK